MARCQGRAAYPTRAKKFRRCPRQAVNGTGLCARCAREELRSTRDVMMHLTGESLLDRGLGLIRMNIANGSAMDVLLKANEAEQNGRGFTTALHYLKKAAGVPTPGGSLTAWDRGGKPAEVLEELFESALLMMRLEKTR